MIVHDEIASTDFNSDNRSDFLLLSDKKRMIINMQGRPFDSVDEMDQRYPVRYCQHTSVDN
ncbi:MAG: hypothetical protein J5723_08570 [Ruminococcus sp.]|nr:hypothetical protein [Ruminococcus sp.]